MRPLACVTVRMLLGCHTRRSSCEGPPLARRPWPRIRTGVAAGMYWHIPGPAFLWGLTRGEASDWMGAGRDGGTGAAARLIGESLDRRRPNGGRRCSRLRYDPPAGPYRVGEPLASQKRADASGSTVSFT
jgi:hypothetical protein